VLEQALANLKRDAEGGVPDLPVVVVDAGEAPVWQAKPAPKRGETQADWAMARQRKLNEGKYR
jgi:hypothetical protein